MDVRSARIRGLPSTAMSSERTRDRGNLFENVQKRKPSQPDLQGDCTIGGTTFEIRAWRRED
jgi:hypothetical protein